MQSSTNDQASSTAPIPSLDQRRSEERISSGIGNTDPEGVAVGPNDVLCGRNKDAFNHPGNKLFRDAITYSVDQYNKENTRAGKSKVVLSVLESIRAKGGRFLKLDSATKEWLPLSDQQAKEKIAHAVRDMEGRKFGRKPIAFVLKKSHSQTNLDSSNHSGIMLSTRSLPGDLSSRVRHDMTSSTNPEHVNVEFYERLQDATRLLNSAGLAASHAPTEPQSNQAVPQENAGFGFTATNNSQQGPALSMASDASMTWPPPMASSMDAIPLTINNNNNFSFGQNTSMMSSFNPMDNMAQNAPQAQPNMFYPSGLLTNDQDSSRPSLMDSASLSYGSSLQRISQDSFQSYDPTSAPQPMEYQTYPQRRMQRDDSSENSMSKLDEEEYHSSPSNSSAASDQFLDTINSVLGPLQPEDHQDQSLP